MKEYKELRKGIYQLSPINSKGEYANINTNTGLILFCKRNSNLLPTPSKISFIEFEKLLSQDQKIWMGKEYIQWRNKHSEVYNIMIDKLNQGLLVI